MRDWRRKLHEFWDPPGEQAAGDACRGGEPSRALADGCAEDSDVAVSGAVRVRAGPPGSSKPENGAGATGLVASHDPFSFDDYLEELPECPDASLASVVEVGQSEDTENPAAGKAPCDKAPCGGGGAALPCDATSGGRSPSIAPSLAPSLVQTATSASRSCSPSSHSPEAPVAQARDAAPPELRAQPATTASQRQRLDAFKGRGLPRPAATAQLNIYGSWDGEDDLVG